MKKKSSVLLAISVFIPLIIVLFIFYTLVVYLTVFSAARQCNSFDSRELMRFKIYGSSYTAEENTVSASISITDSFGNEISVIERSWAGSYLAVEFKYFQMSDRQFVFPSRIYGKKNIFETHLLQKKVTSLEKYYDDNYQCLLPGFGSPVIERKKLYVIARFATGKFHVPDFGFVESYVLDLSECAVGKFYSIQYNALSGRLFVTEI